MNLATRDARLTEFMDDPDCDPVRLRRTLERFGIVNRAVTRWGQVYRRILRPHLAGLGRPARILDIGCGGGDVLRRLVVLARRDGFEVTGLGIDPDPRAFSVATSSTRLHGVEFRQMYSRELLTGGARFDLVVSNHVLHHLADADLAGLFADSAALTTGVSVHSDIARSRFAYAAFAAGAVPVAPGTFLRVDGLRSIRRSYTRAELAARLPRGWRTLQLAPARLLAVRGPARRASAAPAGG